MPIPIQLRYEAQLSVTGRARCRICGNKIEKGTHILKILDYSINQAIHPECVANLTIALGNVLKRLPAGKCYVLRAFDGTVKIGHYKKAATSSGVMFETIETFNLKKEEEESNGSKS